MNIPGPESVEDTIERLEKVRLATLDKDALKEIEMSLRRFRTMRADVQKEYRILLSLRFEVMYDRYSAIPQAHQKTFDWIFTPDRLPPSDPRSRIAFRDWLQNDTGVFWITGKPASGKSTLMRYLCDSQKSRDYLLSWAGSARLATAGFFFWIAGSHLQRSQQGLLRQLLFEILRQYRDLIPTVCEDRWLHEDSATGHDWIDRHNWKPWTLDELREALGRLQNLSLDTRFCFFVDGLDEYDGDHSELIEIVRKLSELPAIKLCVSSRRWPCFEDAFGADSSRRLYLEDLTREDITTFARDKLKEVPQYVQLQKQSQQSFDLVEEIVRKAEGVFLWVFLVVRSLRDGLSNGDSAALLRQRFDELPADLESLFEKIINSVDAVYRRKMAVTFQIALRAPGPVSLLTYWLLDEEDDWTRKMMGPHRDVEANRTIPVHDVPELESNMSRRLYGRYKGLLEPTGRRGKQRVSFLHRTVREYLDTKSAHDIFALPRLDSNTKACKALTAYIVLYGSSGAMPHSSVEYFVMFARWAEIHEESFDSASLALMHEGVARTFGSSILLLQEMIRYGYLPGLQYLLALHPALLKVHGLSLLETALEEPPQTAAKTFGTDHTVSVLDWLLKAGSRTYLSAQKDFFADFLSCGVLGQHEVDYSNLSPLPMRYDIWETYLDVLLHHGWDLNQAFENTGLMDGLPWLGYDQKYLREYVFDSEYEPDSAYFTRLISVYSTLLDHGLDPNLDVHVDGRMRTVWGAWLDLIWDRKYDGEDRLSQAAIVEVMKTFLSKGACPYEVTRSGYTVWASMQAALSREYRDELAPVLESAKTKWSEMRQSREARSMKRARPLSDDPHHGYRLGRDDRGGTFKRRGV